jgi:DNA-binding MarR family transcriptional regulator
VPCEAGEYVLIAGGRIGHRQSCRNAVSAISDIELNLGARWPRRLDTVKLISKLTINILSIMRAKPTADPRHSAIYLGRRFFQVAHAAAAEAHADIGLAPLEFGVLFQLHDNPGIDQNTLAERLALDRTTTSTTVFKLERQGLIKREVNGSDRRARILRLAPQGAALYMSHRPKAQAAQQRVLSVLTPAERKQLAELLTRVIGANQQFLQPGMIRPRRTKGRTPVGR